MLEHFSREEANSFLTECYRIIKPTGFVRIVVPDLENICSEYLRVLKAVRNNPEESIKYEYIVIELLDQMTRKTSGGEMAHFWELGLEQNYVMERTGIPAEYSYHVSTPFKNWVKNLFLYKKYKEYKFNRSGERHLWMYDSYSLGMLLEKHGFKDVQSKAYNESCIPNWNHYQIECNDDGSEYKPNNIYMEAIKP